MNTLCLPFGEAAIEQAARLIRAGQPVAVPTETVYGLAADATSGAAVAAIYAAKGRPAFNPLIVHVADLAAAEALAILSPTLRRLATRWWPGPLTLVAPLRAGAPIARLATAGLPSVAIRVPAHPAIRALLTAGGRPLAAPSANASGTISPTRAEHVLRSLRGRIPLVIDGGPAARGLESTIVTERAGSLQLLRHGPILPEALAETSDLPVHPPIAGVIEAPGQLARHYAPGKPLRLNATARTADEWLIGFGAVAGDSTLSANGDLEEAAATLFDRLHEADLAPSRRIAIAPIPLTGLGNSIADRLARAAAGAPKHG